MEKTRLELFSDAVIAIIITIMVLEMKVPHGAEWGNLLTMLPKFVSYTLSFLFIAIYWVNHHHLLHTVKIATSAIMWANINLLFWLSLVPFATAWMGENHFEKQTVVAYSVLALLCSLAFNLLQRAVVKDHERLKNLEEIIKPKGWKSIGSVILYALAIPIALFLSAAVAGGIFFLVAIIWFVPDRKIEKIESVENAKH